jgi:cellulose synthase/poly-beta-1,6-N-acetylglucosamine synthase-like glycosyltransferase
MVLSIVFSIAYAYLIRTYRQAWKAIPEMPKPSNPQIPITILIPARNEATKIRACLESILNGNYPQNLLKITVLDDFSADNTAQLVRQLPEKLQLSGSSISYIQLAGYLPAEAQFTANKKKALELGIAQAQTEIIVSTDADCEVPKNWLRHLAIAFENPDTQLVCAPVLFHRETNLLQRFQSLDFLGMMGITGAGYQLGWHQMANGANLAYRKTAFETVGGYSGNAHLASGDDMFLVQKVEAKWPGSVVFLKSLEAAVQTEAAPDLRSFWNQRLRWGTKNAAMPSWPMRLSLLLVFLFCWSIWLNLVVALAFAVVGVMANNLWLFLFQITVKVVFDYFFLKEMCHFFNRKDLMRWFLPSFFLHTAYIPILGTASLFFKKYEWKARRAQ